MWNKRRVWWESQAGADLPDTPGSDTAIEGTAPNMLFLPSLSDKGCEPETGPELPGRWVKGRIGQRQEEQCGSEVGKGLGSKPENPAQGQAQPAVRSLTHPVAAWFNHIYGPDYLYL